MIEQLHTLLKGAGVKAITLNLTDNNNDNVQVVMQTQLHPEENNCTAAVRNIRTALSAQILVSGYVGEVDAHFTKEIQNYTDKAQAALSGIVSNVREKTSDISDADAENVNDDLPAETEVTSVSADTTNTDSL
jgi:hypothetical protein